MSWTRPPARSKQYAGTAPDMPRPAPLRIADGKARLTISLPKHPPLRSEPYRRWVASLDCIHCGKAGSTQAAHSDTGKGAGIKSGDDTCIPLCATSAGREGCHAIFGASGKLTREQRRTLEAMYSQAIRERAMEENAWPKEWNMGANE